MIKSLVELTTVSQPTMTPAPDYGMFNIDKETYDLFEKVNNSILTLIVSIIGLCGNGLGLFVMWNDFMNVKQTIYRYMFALMLFDFVFLILGMITGIIATIQIFDWYIGNEIRMYAAYGLGYLDLTLYHTTSVLLIVMSLERLNALLRPLVAKQSWFNIYPRRIVVMTFCFFLLYALPYPLIMELNEVPKDNRTIKIIEVREPFKGFHKDYTLAETCLSLTFSVLLTITNITLPIAYCRYINRKRSSLRSSGDSQQLKITMMILWITILYTLLSLPKIFIQILKFIDQDYTFYGKYGDTYHLFLFLGDLFARVNAANDFFVYVLIYKRYRDILVRLFKRWFCQQDEQQTFYDIFTQNNNRVSKTGKKCAESSVTDSASPSTETVCD